MKFKGAKAFLIAGILVAVAGAVAVALVRRPRLTPALRGLNVAREHGCFACHGPGGTGGVPNPGSDEEFVPAWDGGTAMMYVENEGEIREWILYGRPISHEHDEHPDTTEAQPQNGDDHKHTGLPIDMPAFKDFLSAGELDDLVDYYKVVAAFEPPPPDAGKGYHFASKLGCFGCHGPGGRIGSPNPRSFKGYIPPWQGKDFADLVRSDDELRDWILDGHIDRIESNWFARQFTRRQAIQMPAYREVLTDDALEALVTYIKWLNESS